VKESYIGLGVDGDAPALVLGLRVGSAWKKERFPLKVSWKAAVVGTFPFRMLCHGWWASGVSVAMVSGAALAVILFVLARKYLSAVWKVLGECS
jgi:hypothetical protein